MMMMMVLGLIYADDEDFLINDLVVFEFLQLYLMSMTLHFHSRMGGLVIFLLNFRGPNFQKKINYYSFLFFFCFLWNLPSYVSSEMKDEYKIYRNQLHDNCMVYQMYEHVNVSFDLMNWQIFDRNLHVHI